MPKNQQKNKKRQAAIAVGLVMATALIWISLKLFVFPKDTFDPMTQEIAKDVKKVVDAPKAAISNPSQVVSENKSNTDQLLEDAIELSDTHQTDQAIQILENMIKKEPNHERALLELGYAYLSGRKDRQQPIKSFQRVLEVNPNNRDALNELARIYLDADNSDISDEGIAFFQNLQTKNPNSTEVAKAYGNVLYGKGKYAEAISQIEKALSADPDNEHLIGDLADAYAHSAQPQKAIENYRKALDRLTIDYLDESKRGALSMYTKEKMNLTRNDLAQQLINVGSYKDAQTVIDELREENPTNPNISFLQQDLDKAANRYN